MPTACWEDSHILIHCEADMSTKTKRRIKHKIKGVWAMNVREQLIKIPYLSRNSRYSPSL